MTTKEYRARLVNHFVAVYRDLTDRVGQVDMVRLRPEECLAVARYWKAAKPNRAMVANEPLLIFAVGQVTLEIVFQVLPETRFVMKVVSR